MSRTSTAMQEKKTKGTVLLQLLFACLFQGNNFRKLTDHASCSLGNAGTGMDLSSLTHSSEDFLFSNLFDEFVHCSSQMATD